MSESESEMIIRFYVGDKEYVVSGDYVEQCWKERGSPEVSSKEDVQELMEYVISRIQQEENSDNN